MTKTEIKVIISVYGSHNWDGAHKARSYLSHPHVHQFFITGYAEVQHDDRDIEFHDLRDMLHGVVKSIWPYAGETRNIDFGGSSCEMIARQIMEHIPQLNRVEVSEDNQCSAIVSEDKVVHGVQEETDRGLILTLCGSTKYKVEYGTASLMLEEFGVSTFSVGGFMHADKIPFTPEKKEELDALHKRKIDKSDGIFVVNPTGYVGDSTRSEILHAHKTGKLIFAMYPDTWNIEGEVINSQGITECTSHDLNVRKEVLTFAREMEKKLIQNDYKGGWQKRSVHDLAERMRLEFVELEEAIRVGESGGIINECADIGNFAMMIMDVLKKRRGK